jgi:hypothetical protein
MAARKKTAKKTTTTRTTKKKTKKAPAKTKAGATRPKFKASAAANRAMTERKTMFFSFPANTTTTVRIIPRYDDVGLEQGALFVLQRLHYDVEGGFSLPNDPQRKIAPACLQEHGDGNCYMCNLIDWLKAQDDERLQNLGSDLYATEQLQAQAWILDPSSKDWYGPKIVKVPKSVANDMTNAISMAEDNDMPVFCDPDEGMGMAVTRTGQGRFGTKYSTQLTGKVMSMDDIDPDWWERCIKDLPAKLDMKVLNIDEQKEILVHAHPDLPWDAIEDDIG